MRILYFYSSHQIDTGSPKALLGLIDALDRTRHVPLFLTGGSTEGALVREMAARGVELVRGEVTEASLRRPIASLAAVLRSAALLRRARADVLHVNEFGWNLDVVLAAPFSAVPAILHVHNPLDVAARNLDRIAAKRVVFVSEAHRRSTRHLERIEGRSTVLHNPVDIERFESGRDIRGALGLAPSDVVVVTVCQITPNKALDVVLAAARELVPRWPQLRFVVAGRAGVGHEAYADGIMAEAAEPPLAGRVHFLGSRTDVPDVLASSDIFFLPTRSETFGIVVAEAMAASLPVVTTNVGGIPEIVRGDHEGRILEPDDLPGFVRAIELLIADPAARAALGRAGREGLDGRFDRATFARALDALYASL
ncbi:MAG TPA: glycosyltransferase family 4 protein [Gemmatimonadales bacterium]|nr:glycosyltransferase family 4 protein [Gemmatimonadales bacterium]